MQPNPPTDITAADLHAITLLAVSVEPRATRKSLDDGDEHTQVLSALLGTGQPRGNWQIDWQAYRELLSHPDVAPKLDAAVSYVHGLAPSEYAWDQHELRILDAALWTYESWRSAQERREQRAPHGETVTVEAVAPDAQGSGNWDLRQASRASSNGTRRPVAPMNRPQSGARSPWSWYWLNDGDQTCSAASQERASFCRRDGLCCSARRSAEIVVGCGGRRHLHHPIVMPPERVIVMRCPG